MDYLLTSPSVSINGEPRKTLNVYIRPDGSGYSDDARIVVSGRYSSGECSLRLNAATASLALLSLNLAGVTESIGWDEIPHTPAP
jgi:hypothetical protein